MRLRHRFNLESILFGGTFLLWAIFSLAWAHDAFANPILTSDPMCFDASGADASCPSGIEYSQDAGTTWQDAGVQIDTNSLVVWHDLEGLAHGDYSFLLRSYNIWGVSEEVPFDFAAGIPVSPFGLRIISPPP